MGHTYLPLVVGGRSVVRIGLMAALIYRCPTTGQKVQGWLANDESDDGESYETVTCAACRQVHLVNPKTGKTLGFDEE
jgi:hypothetical protein